MSFNVGNVFKYLWRAGLKTPKVDALDPKSEEQRAKELSLQDHKKAFFYLKDEIERLERELNPLIAVGTINHLKPGEAHTAFAGDTGLQFVQKQKPIKFSKWVTDLSNFWNDVGETLVGESFEADLVRAAAILGLKDDALVLTREVQDKIREIRSADFNDTLDVAESLLKCYLPEKKPTAKKKGLKALDKHILKVVADAQRRGGTVLRSAIVEEPVQLESVRGENLLKRIRLRVSAQLKKSGYFNDFFTEFSKTLGRGVYKNAYYNVPVVLVPVIQRTVSIWEDEQDSNGEALAYAILNVLEIKK
jgi:hypothetical protein